MFITLYPYKRYWIPWSIQHASVLLACIYLCSYQCHHGCFWDVGNTHWLRCAAGARTIDMRTWNSWCMITELVYDYWDEPCTKRSVELASPIVCKWLSSPNHDDSTIPSLLLVLLNFLNVPEIWISCWLYSLISFLLSLQGWWIMDDRIDPTAECWQPF